MKTFEPGGEHYAAKRGEGSPPPLAFSINNIHFFTMVTGINLQVTSSTGGVAPATLIKD
jgi:hypothetical protein